MSKTYHRYYLGGVAVAVVVAGFLAVKVGVNLHDVLKDFSRAPQPTATAPQKPKALATPAAVAPEWRTALAAHVQKLPSAERESLARVYEQFGYAPLWVTNASRLRDLSSSAAFAEAQAIDITTLSHLLQTVGNRAAALEASAVHDIKLTAEAMRLAEALRLGALPAATLGRSWILPADSFDAAHGLTAALKNDSLKAFMAGLAPPDPAYKNLVAALSTYRDIVENGGWPQIPGKDEVKLEDDLTLSDARTIALRDRLTAEGYLRAGAAVDAAQLTGAVKTFQERNGLEPDGRIGRDTIAALNVPAHDRVGQIAANLERWRHTPRERGDRYIAVNTAATTLDYITNGKSTLHLKTVTGAPRHATPILTAKITSIVLNPVWSIPPSISTKEILPKLQKDPNYLANNNMVVINGPESDPHGQAIDWSQYDAKTLPFSFRQRAGDDNALGYIKFHMPNPQNIYLHDTPSRSFFAKAERHLSHGCVRVDQPQILGEHVLKQESPEWTAEALTARFGNGGTQSIALKTPLPVYTFYWTVFPENGTIAFRTDVYKRDKVLADALGLKVFGGTTPEDVKQNIAAN